MSAVDSRSRARRRFRFSLGTLLIVMSILSAIFALSAKEYHRVRRERNLLQKLRAAAGDGRVGGDVPHSTLNPRTYLRRVFGDDGFATEYSFFSETDFRQISDDDLQLLADLPRLTRIDLIGPSFTDRSLSSFKGCKTLESLILRETEVTAAGLRQLQHASSLRRLFLIGSAVNDSTLTCLEAFPKLEELWLDETSITDQGLENLKYVPQLKELYLSDAPLVNRGPVNLPRLESLRLARCRVSNSAMRDVGTLKHLVQLEFTECEVDGSAIALLNDLPELFRLELLSNGITGNDLAPLVGLPKLEVLLVLPSTVDNDAVKNLQRFNTLRFFAVKEGIEESLVTELRNALPTVRVSRIDDQKGIIPADR
jgi:Leucine-rich repeat (LRR) protein